jgi:ankyrin repeat protein
MQQQYLIVILIAQLACGSVVSASVEDSAIPEPLSAATTDPNKPQSGDSDQATVDDYQQDFLAPGNDMPLYPAEEPTVPKSTGQVPVRSKSRKGTGQGVGYPGYRGQGGGDYPGHRQYGSPPGASTAQHAADQNRLLQAATRGDLVAVDALLVRGTNPDARAADKHQRTALILAAAGGHRETAAALLASGAAPENKDASGLTALNWAAMRGRNQVAALLLENGADVNTRDQRGASPLLYAIGTRNAPLVKLFTTGGAEFEVESDESKMTPLLLAIELGDSGLVATLVERGADVNGTNSDGFSPLMAAAEKGQVDLVKLFLEKGADKGARDSSGASAQSLAQKNGYDEAFDLLSNNRE